MTRANNSKYRRIWLTYPIAHHKYRYTGYYQRRAQQLIKKRSKVLEGLVTVFAAMLTEPVNRRRKIWQDNHIWWGMLPSVDFNGVVRCHKKKRGGKIWKMYDGSNSSTPWMTGPELVACVIAHKLNEGRE